MNPGAGLPVWEDPRELQFLLFGGKGGVGKTTCAAATALRLARKRPEQSFLLVSTDPAHSLQDCLAGLPALPNLKVLELDAPEYLAAFKEKHGAQLRGIASRGTFLDEEDLNRLLELSLPGMDELISFLEITGWLNRRAYHCVIVDTAPTGHTLRLLAMPGLIRQWLQALDAMLAKHRYMKKVFSGRYRRDQYDVFLEDLSASLEQMESLMKDPGRCRFVPVMLAEKLSIRETLALLKELAGLKVPVSEVVVNRLYPEAACPVCQGARSRQSRELAKMVRPGALSGYSLWGVPVYPGEVRGERLEEFWTPAAALTDPLPLLDEVPPDADFSVEAPAAPVPAGITLLLFAGKGGVGKTTLACATALGLARDLPGREILLFSADPAHSLSDCLEVTIGDRPTSLAPGLTALEINAQAEFDSLKRQYQKELEEFLGAVLPSLDLQFDREVMERILDLSPPGLDEIMALTRVIEFLAEGGYDLLILDAAPTGHLIRLLELPQLIDQWLKVFFGLFLKYREIFRLPQISQRLVKMSKDLKFLRTLLGDPKRSEVSAVSILTEMAFQETADLMAACDRIGVQVPALFLNLATPASPCSLCSALYQRESQVKEKFKRAFPRVRQTLVYGQGEPRGRDRLQNLGAALYRHNGREQWGRVKYELRKAS